MHTGSMHSGPMQSGAAPAGQIFALHFAHAAPATVAALADPVPADAPAATPSATQPHVANAAYSYEGSREALPLRVFDDGTSTWFRFAETMDLPAIFAREPDGSLAVANIANRDGYVVIDRIAASFELRRGKAGQIASDRRSESRGEAMTDPVRPKPDFSTPDASPFV
eukprot:gene24050-29668_t